VLGLALGALSTPVPDRAITLLATIGAIFANLIRMTVIPLVTSMPIASIGSMGASRALPTSQGRHPSSW
jgi:Na+/H+-dicarboxylate symporter